MTDWTTCRVVRDGKGRLRTDDGPIRDSWAMGW